MTERSHEAQAAVGAKAREIAEKHWPGVKWEVVPAAKEMVIVGRYEIARPTAGHLYRTWVSLPILEEAEWTDEERESKRVQAPDKDGQK